MDEDDIAKLIRQGVAGAIFEISHQNYPVAMRLIDLVQKLARKYNRPVSLIQDVSGMQDPLDLQIGARGGVHWVATDNPEHVKLARGLNKLAGIIYKDRKLPKGMTVDSVMSSDFVDPDAEIAGHARGQIKHLIVEHKDQKLLDALSHIASHACAAGIAVQDLGLAQGLSHRRVGQKIIFAPKTDTAASKAAIYWGVHPVFGQTDIIGAIKNANILSRGSRMLDATQPRHITIHTI